MLPLIGRISDLRGRVPVLTAALLLFAFGSLVTALAYDLPSMVTGRFLQGVGAGGLVPATLALVADLYPAERRGVPLGIVSGVQELGSVIGPLFGAIVLAFGTWRSIFAINLAVALVLAAAISRSRDRTPDRRRFDWFGAALLGITLVAGALVFVRPPPIMRDLTWGALFVPYAGNGRWLTPLGAIAMGAALAFVLWCVFAKHPLIDLPSWWRSVRSADLPGSLLLAVSLAGVIAAFATADPRVQVFSPRGGWYLVGSADRPRAARPSSAAYRSTRCCLTTRCDCRGLGALWS